METMEKILTILKTVCPMVDFQQETELMSKKKIASLELVSIVVELEEEFDITIDPQYIKPENFDSVEKIVALVEKLKLKVK